VLQIKTFLQFHISVLITKDALMKKNVQFLQADLTRDDHVAKVFRDVKFDYVINACGETRFGLSEEDYKKKVLEPAIKCAQVAAELKVQKFIELSSAQVYRPDVKAANDEDGALAPWTIQAKYRLDAENKVKEVKGLPWVILRPAYIYGPGDLTSITPRIICAAVYQDRKEKMKFLWEGSLKLNTVHIDDVVAAIWWACTTASPSSTYNLADESNSDQGAINGLLGQIFGIEVGFWGSMLSNVAKMKLSAVAEEANDKHVPGWTMLCKTHNINNTPLSPYIDQELLKNNGLFVDGTAIARAGFRYTRPRLTRELIEDVIQKFVEQGLFPPILQGGAAAAAPAADAAVE